MVVAVLPFSSVTDFITPPSQSHVMERERVSGSEMEVTNEFPQEGDGVPVLL